MEIITDKLTVATGEEYKKTIDEWALAFARRHLENLVIEDPLNINYADIFGLLRQKGIIAHCEATEELIGVPRTVTYSFTSGDVILAELIIKLSF